MLAKCVVEGLWMHLLLCLRAQCYVHNQCEGAYFRRKGIQIRILNPLSFQLDIEFRYYNIQPSKIGTWRSLVAHLDGVQGAGSSNLLVPTILDNQKGQSEINQIALFLVLSQKRFILTLTTV